MDHPHAPRHPRTPQRPAGSFARLASIALLPLVLACGAEAPEAPEAPEETSAASEAPAAPVDGFAASFAGPIEAAHGLDAWSSAAAIATDMALDFGGNRVLDGRMVFTPEMGRVRLDTAEGATVYWNEGTAWVSPAEAAVPRARFHVLTWPYFLAAPMKLRDPGTRLEDLGSVDMGEASYEAARLTFDAGVGDTPDDWYVLYRDPSSDRLAAMAYIVTYGTPTEEAEAEPHAIRYDDFRDVGGVSIPHAWYFHNWNEAEGIHGEPIGEMRLSEARLVGDLGELEVAGVSGAALFTPPDGAREEGLPEAAGD